MRTFYHNIGLWVSLGGIFLINEWHGGTQFTEGSATHGKVVLAGVRKQAEKRHDEEANKQPSSTVSASPAITSLRDGLLPRSGGGNKPLSSHVGFGHGVSL